MRMMRSTSRKLSGTVELEDYDGSFDGKATLTADRGGYGVRDRRRKVWRVFLTGGVYV